LPLCGCRGFAGSGARSGAWLVRCRCWFGRSRGWAPMGSHDPGRAMVCRHLLPAAGLFWGLVFAGGAGAFGLVVGRGGREFLLLRRRVFVVFWALFGRGCGSCPPVLESDRHVVRVSHCRPVCSYFCMLVFSVFISRVPCSGSWFGGGGKVGIVFAMTGPLLYLPDRATWGA